MRLFHTNTTDTSICVCEENNTTAGHDDDDSRISDAFIDKNPHRPAGEELQVSE